MIVVPASLNFCPVAVVRTALLACVILHASRSDWLDEKLHQGPVKQNQECVTHGRLDVTLFLGGYQSCLYIYILI